MSRFWTQAEDRLIEREYPFGGYRRVQEFLPHRSQQAIANRASFLEVRAKLTKQDRILILGLSKWLTQEAIAEKFGVCRYTIYKVLKTA